MQDGSLTSHPLQHLLFVDFFNDGHSDWCEVITHCSLDLHFSNNEPCYASFHMFVGYLYIFFGEIHQQMNGYRNCGTYIQWNSTQL